MGAIESKPGLYLDSKFNDAINQVCTIEVSCSMTHRPDVMERLRPDESKTVKSSEIEVLPEEVAELFTGKYGADAKTLERLRASFVKRSVRKYGETDFSDGLRLEVRGVLPQEHTQEDTEEDTKNVDTTRPQEVGYTIDVVQLADTELGLYVAGILAQRLLDQKAREEVMFDHYENPKR